MGTDAVIITYGGLLVQLFGFTHNLQKRTILDCRLLCTGWAGPIHCISHLNVLIYCRMKTWILFKHKKIVIWILFLFDEINLHISLRLVRVIGLIQAHCGVRLNVEMITLAGSSNDYELGEDLVIRCFSENSMVWCSYLVNILRHILCWNLDITEADHTDYIESWRHWY